MKTLNVLLVGISLFIGINTTTAQERQKKTPQERAELHTARMAKVLELTDEQKAKIMEVNVGIAMKNDAIRTDSEMTKEQKEDRIKDNMAARKIMFQSILTEDQMKKLEENEAAMKEKRSEKKEEFKKRKKDSIENETPEETEEL